jgi:hypothetical protein
MAANLLPPLKSSRYTRSPYFASAASSYHLPLNNRVCSRIATDPPSGIEVSLLPAASRFTLGRTGHFLSSLMNPFREKWNSLAVSDVREHRSHVWSPRWSDCLIKCQILSVGRYSKFKWRCFYDGKRQSDCQRNCH